MERQLYRRKEVQKITGLASSTLYDLIRRGEFPRPVKVGHASAWRVQDVSDWLDSLTSKADAA